MQIRESLSWEDLESVSTMINGDLRFKEGNTIFQGPIDSIHFRKEHIEFHLTFTLMWVAPKSQWRKTTNSPVLLRRDQTRLGEEDEGHIGIIAPELRDMEIVLNPEEKILTLVGKGEIEEENLLLDEP